MAQRAAELSDKPRKGLAHRSSHTPIHHLPQKLFWGNPLENAQADPRAPVLQPLRGPERGRGLPAATQLSKTPGTTVPKDSPLHATSHHQPGLEVQHKGQAGVWMLAGAPFCACRPGGGDRAEWEVLWAAQPELRRRRGRQGREQRLELQGLLPSTAQDLSPGLMAWSGQPSSGASLAGRGLQGCRTSGCGTLGGAAPLFPTL